MEFFYCLFSQKNDAYKYGSENTTNYFANLQFDG
jgi:hypothetical protein